MRNITLISLIFIVLSFPCASTSAQKPRTDTAANVSTFSTLISRPGVFSMAMIAVHRTSDGGYITASSDTDGVVIAKTNSAGKKSWERVIGFISSGANIHRFDVEDIQQTADGGYLFVGTDDFHLWLARLKSDGTTVWEKRTDYYVGYGSMVQKGDGTFLVAAQVERTILLTKFDAAGNAIWKKQFAATRGAVFDAGLIMNRRTDLRSLRMVHDGSGLLMAFNMYTPNGAHNGLRIIRLDAEGNTRWSKDLSDEMDKGKPAMVHSLAVTSDGGFVLYGNINRGFVTKYDRDGGHQWDAIIGGRIYGGDIVERAGGGFAICGSYNTNRDSGLMFSTMDIDGKIVSTHIFGIKEATWHECNSLETTGDGGYVIGGKYELHKGDLIVRQGGWLLKLDAGGNNMSEPQFDLKKLATTVNRFGGSGGNILLGKHYRANCDTQGAFAGVTNYTTSTADYNRDTFEVKRLYRLNSISETALWEPGETELSYRVDNLVFTGGRASGSNNIFKGTLKRGTCLVEKPLICTGSDDNQNLFIKPGTYLITLPDRRCDSKTGNIYQREIVVLGLPVEEDK